MYLGIILDFIFCPIDLLLLIHLKEITVFIDILNFEMQAINSCRKFGNRKSYTEKNKYDR